MSTWKHLLLKALGVGVGIGIGLGLVIAIGIWYSSRPSVPRPWDTKSITATYQSAQFASQPEPAAYFRYVLQNNTDQDYSVSLMDSQGQASSTIKLAARERQLHSDNSADATGATPISDANVTLVFGGVEASLPNVKDIFDLVSGGKPLFIPAKQKVQVRLRWALNKVDMKHATSVQLVNEGLYGFVLFDEANRYQIEFPKPSVLKGTLTEADIDPWDRYRVTTTGKEPPKTLPADFFDKEQRVEVIRPDGRKSTISKWELNLAIKKGYKLAPSEKTPTADENAH